MTATFDPFAEAEKATEEPEVTMEADPPASESSGFQDNSEPFVSVTLKGGSGYDSPWTVLYFTDIEDADYQLEHKKEAVKRILDNSAQMGGYYSRLNRGSGGKQQPQQQSGPQQAPDGQSRYCQGHPEHGPKLFKSGVVKRGPNQGKTWQAFDCAQGVCDREWMN